MMADEFVAADRSDRAAALASVEAVAAAEASLDRWLVEQATFELPRPGSISMFCGSGRLVLRKGPHKGAIVPEEWRDF
jgi:hypothetical protein